MISMIQSSGKFVARCRYGEQAALGRRLVHKYRRQLA